MQKDAPLVGCMVGQKGLHRGDSSANRQCDTDFATDVTDFSEAIRHYFRRQKHVSVMTYASVGSDGAKSSQVFIEPNVKANSAGYCENAGRKCVSVDTKILIQPISSPTSSPRTVRRLPQPLTRRLGVSHPDVWCRQHSAPSFPKEMWPPLNHKLNSMDFSISSVFKSKVSWNAYTSIAALRRNLEAARRNMDEDTVRRTCASASGRLKPVRRARRPYIAWNM